MQYILSQEELDALKKEQSISLKLGQRKLQQLCTTIADTMPIKWGWGGTDPKPWGCIKTAGEEWYCDQCPVIEICPSNKNFSK